MNFEDFVSFGYSELSRTMKIIGPFETDYHINYVVDGLCCDDHQIKNLCYTLLGFIGDIIEDDMRISSALDSGLDTGLKLKQELKNLLRNSWLKPKEELTKAQVISNRNPLILELIAHTVIKLQKDNPLFSFTNYVPIKVRPPHIKANESGIDLIALVQKDNKFYPFIGEVKAYYDNPGKGLIDACSKFLEVTEGLHNSEIRRSFKSFKLMSSTELGNKFWEKESLYSAVVGNDSEFKKEEYFCSRSQQIINVNCNTLFFVSHNFLKMNDLFEKIITILNQCIDELEE